MKPWERWAVWIGTQLRTIIGNGIRRFHSTATVSDALLCQQVKLSFVLSCQLYGEWASEHWHGQEWCAPGWMEQWTDLPNCCPVSFFELLWASLSFFEFLWVSLNWPTKLLSGGSFKIDKIMNSLRIVLLLWPFPIDTLVLQPRMQNLWPSFPKRGRLLLLHLHRHLPVGQEVDCIHNSSSLQMWENQKQQQCTMSIVHSYFGSPASMENKKESLAREALVTMNINLLKAAWNNVEGVIRVTQGKGVLCRLQSLLNANSLPSGTSPMHQVASSSILPLMLGHSSFAAGLYRKEKLFHHWYLLLQSMEER